MRPFLFVHEVYLAECPESVTTGEVFYGPSQTLGILTFGGGAMLVKDQDGKAHKAHLLGKYGQVVLVVDGKQLGHYDVAGLTLVEATDEERADLNRAGYSFREE